MLRHALTLEVLKSEYDAALKLARDRGVTLARHPDIDKLTEGNAEDLDFIESLIQRIETNVLRVPPVRR